MEASRVRWQSCHESAWQNIRTPIAVRVHYAKMRSAAFARVVYRRGRKVHGVAPQRMTTLREDGGCIGDVAALMVCDPINAHEVIEHLRSFLPSTSHRPLIELIIAEQRSDCAEDIAQTEYLADQTPEKLAAYRDELRAAIAAAQRLLDAVNHELTERGQE